MKNKVLRLTEEQLYQLSKGLAGAVFRNGVVEDLHSESAILDDETMCMLNHDVCNRIYGILKLAISSDERSHKILENVLNFHTQICNHWDNPEMIDEFQWTDQELEAAAKLSLFNGKRTKINN